MITQGKDVEIGGGIVYMISTALKMILCEQQKPKNEEWVEISEEEHKKLTKKEVLPE